MFTLTNHAPFKLSGRLAWVALNTCLPMVKAVISATQNTGATKTHQEISTLKG